MGSPSRLWRRIASLPGLLRILASAVLVCTAFIVGRQSTAAEIASMKALSTQSVQTTELNYLKDRVLVLKRELRDLREKHSRFEKHNESIKQHQLLLAATARHHHTKQFTASADISNVSWPTHRNITRDAAAPLRVIVIFGTRPEVIKMAPVVRAMRAAPDIEVLAVDTGQHREMTVELKRYLQLDEDINLNVMRPMQTLSSLVALAYPLLADLISRLNPDLVMVQGDTTTAMIAGLAAFNLRTHVGHVEAGLRTGYLQSPYPEEGNRRVLGVVCTLCFAPTGLSASNLAHEGVMPRRIITVGNTVIDQLFWSKAHPPNDAKSELWLDPLPQTNDDGSRIPAKRVSLTRRTAELLAQGEHVVLVTAHRRENLGDPLRDMMAGIADAALAFPDTLFVFPVHANPRVRRVVVPFFEQQSNVLVVEPLDYPYMVQLLARVTLVVTDSGGIQEEAVSLGLPTLVMRGTTERPEGVIAGITLLVGTSRQVIADKLSQLLRESVKYRAMAHGSHVYGDGKATPRILETLRLRKAELRALPSAAKADFRTPHSFSELSAEDAAQIPGNQGRVIQPGSVGVVVNVYRRPVKFLRRQLKAILEQTLAPSEVYIWQNERHVDISSVLLEFPSVRHVHSPHWNARMFGRFMIPLLMNTEFVGVVDDDLVPGPGFLESAVNTVRRTGMLVGSTTRSFRWPDILEKEGNKDGFLDASSYWNVHYDSGAGESGKEVDFVGHWWVFRREWAHHMWSRPFPSLFTAEDASISAMLQINAGINTFAAPRPAADQDVWGELPMEKADWLETQSTGSYKEVARGAQREVVPTNMVRLGIFRYWLRQGWLPVGARIPA